jgi:hypothetical protein
MLFNHADEETDKQLPVARCDWREDILIGSGDCGVQTRVQLLALGGQG